jgi:hypothetical protein
MFKVVFTKLVPVRTWDQRPEQFYRFVELPFAPFVGLSVRGAWGTTDSALAVKYDVESGVFWCDTGIDESLLDAHQEALDPSDRLTLAEKVTYMEDTGWLQYTRETAPPYWPGSKA